MKKRRSDRVADIGFFLFSGSTLQAIDLMFGVPVTWGRALSGMMIGVLLVAIGIAIFMREQSKTTTDNLHEKTFGKPRA